MKHIYKQILFLTVFTLVFDFLGCGSADIQSAKLYRQQRDYRRANTMIEQALKSDPQSDEAWALYMQNLYDLKQYEKIAELVDTARLYAIKNRALVEMVRRNTWVELYNGGVNAYQQNPDSKEQQQAAIGFLESAKKVAPDQPETYEVLGDVYYSAGDTAKGVATYKEALEQVRSVHDQGVALGLHMRMEPPEVETAIGGSPSKDTTVWIGGNDSARVYNYRSNDGWFYFERAAKPPHKWQLTGWRFTNVFEVGIMPEKVSVTPYQRLGNYYYSLGNSVLAKDKSKAEDYYNEAIPMYIAIQKLDPSDENAAALISDIFNSKLKQPEKAKSQYERLIAEHPSKSIYTAYGATLLTSNDYEGAIAAFNNALKIDPSYATALFDLGATYKNWAAADQKKQPPPATGKDKKKGEQEPANDPVRQKLEKSTEYFEQVLAVNRKEYGTYLNLWENYEYLGKKDKSGALVASLENMKNSDASKDAEYHDALGKLYVRVNRPNESAEEFKKADQLRAK